MPIIYPRTDLHVLKLANEYFDDVKNGKKTSTLRLRRNNSPAIYAGDTIRFEPTFPNCINSIVVEVFVTNVRVIKFKDISNKEVQSENFNSLDELHKALRKHYSGIISFTEFILIDYFLI